MEPEEPATPSRPSRFGSDVALPSSPLGRIGDLLVDAINDRGEDRLREFLDTYPSESLLEERPTGGWLSFLRKLREQSGGLDAIEVVSEENPLSLRVRSRKGGHRADLVLFGEPGEPGRLAGLYCIPVAADPDPWPEGEMGKGEVADAIRHHVQARSSRDAFSGVVLVARGGDVVVHEAYGLAERSFASPNRPDTKFNLGSMNKMFTSVAIAQQVRAGRLSFEDRLADVLPEYPNRDAAERITIHHLLTHTAGLGDIFKPALREHRERYVDPRDYFPLFADEPLLFEPGGGWSYSNAGFVVLGAVLERASGEDYFDYVRGRIFEPAGMRDTDSYELTEVVPNLAVGYARFDDDPLGIEPRRSNVAFLPWRGSPAGGGYSTAPDLLRFARALRGYELLDEELTELVTSRKVELGGTGGYGYGFSVREFGGREIRGHSGGGVGSGINSDLEIVWDGSYTVIALGNYDAPAAQDLAQAICEFLAKR